MRKSLQNNAVTPIALCLMSDFVEDPTMSAAVAAPGSRSSTSAGSSLARSSSASSFGVFCVQRLDRRLLLRHQAGERSSQLAQSVGMSVRRLDRYGREILWQHAPAAIRSGHVADRVQDLAQVRHHAPPGLGRARQERFIRDHSSCVRSEVIALGLLLDIGHTATRRSGPHPKLETRLIPPIRCPPCSRPLFGRQLILLRFEIRDVCTISL